MKTRRPAIRLGPLAFLAAVAAFWAALCQPAAQAASQPKRAIPLFIFAGQSNMLVLNTNTNDLLPEQRLAQSQVLFYGPTETGSTWAPLQPPTVSDGAFGPEISTGQQLTELAAYDLVAEVKLAISGSNLYYQWDPEAAGSLYQQLFNRVQAARQSLEAQYPGDDVYIAGFFWMQGEADAANAAYAAAYQANLGHLIDRVRADYGDPAMPFMVGRIRATPFVYAGQVRAAQAGVAAAKPGVRLVDTDALPRQADNVHFSSAGTYQLGFLFAHAYLDLPLTAGAYLPMLGR